MGKKSLLAPTSGENTGSEKDSEKKKKPMTATAEPKKAAPKPIKKKKAAAKKKAPVSKTAKKEAEPKSAPKEKKGPLRRTATAKSSVRPKAKKADADSISGDAPKKVEVETTSRIPRQTDTGKASAPITAARVERTFPEEKKTMDSTQKMASVGLVVLALLLVMVLWSSASNVGKFYVKQVDGQLEIWKGRFSPKGMDKVFILNSTSMSVEPKDVYSKEEAYTLIFEGIIADADALLGTDEMPDFELIRRTLASAEPFAFTGEMAQRLQKRLDKIDMMALVYKADILAGKGTVEDLTRARESLKKAIGLNLDEAEKGLIQQKISWVDQMLESAAEE